MRMSERLQARDGSADFAPGELDIENFPALERWLRHTGRVEATTRLEPRLLAGGVSNRTVWLERSGGQPWVIKQALERLRVAVEWLSSPARIHREAQGLRALFELAPPGTITPWVFEDESQHVLGMEAVPLPHENWKDCLLAGRIELELGRQFGELLGTIHQRSFEQAPRFQAAFADRSFFEGLRLEPFYEFTARQCPALADFLTSLAHQTRKQQRCLVHGDFSPKNILVHAGRLVLVDHEVIHWGDPMFDVGFALAHLLCKAHAFPQRRENLAALAKMFLSAYLEAVPRSFLESKDHRRAVRHTLACLAARVAGRSPVNYLDPIRKERQLRAVCDLSKEPPQEGSHLVPAFLERLPPLA